MIRLRNVMQPDSQVAAACRDFTDLAKNISKLTDFCINNQYFYGFDGVSSNDYEWYDFVNFLCKPENLDYWGINDDALAVGVKSHPYVVQFVPYLFTLHARLVIEQSKSKVFRDAFDRIYAKIKAGEPTENKHLHDTIYSADFIRECIIELMSDFVEVKDGLLPAPCRIDVIQKVIDRSPDNVYIHLSASGFDLSNVKRLHTIANALYSVFVKLLEENNYEGPMIIADMQLLVSNTILDVTNLQEEVEALKVDRKKFIEYFKEYASPSIFSNLLDICLEFDDVTDGIQFPLEKTNYKVFSAFCKLFYENTAKSENDGEGTQSLQASLRSFSHNAFALPPLHIGYRKSKIADEIHDYQYYRYISERYESCLTTSEFIDRINKDYNMDVHIELIPHMVGMIEDVEPTLKFYVGIDKDELTLHSISVIVDKYLAIVEYLYTQFGRQNFNCYGYSVQSKVYKTSQDEWKKINKLLHNLYENDK